MIRDHRNPFDVAADEEYFDELFTSAWSCATGQPSNQTNALAWLEQWQKDNPLPTDPVPDAIE